MRLANVWNLGVKELRSLRRDTLLLAFVVYAFSVSTYTAATALPETLHLAPMAVVDEDRSQLSARIVDAFYPPQFVTPEHVDLAGMDSGMDAGLYTFGLVIPAGLERDLLAGRAPEIQLNVDATRMSQAFTGSSYIQAIVSAEVDTFVRGHRAEAQPLVDLALRARFNPELDRTWFGSVMQVVSNVTMLSIILAGAALIREREHGTVEHLLVMPVTPSEIMAAKIWSTGAVVLLAATLSLTLIVRGALQVPIEGSLALFLAGAALHLFATTSMGIMLATLARSMPQFGMLILLVLVPLELLSGGTTPRESMPEIIQTLMLAAPNTHFIIVGQSVLFRGAGLEVVWPQFLALALIGTAMFAFSLSRFRKGLERMS